jgi:predicted ArsR family transcriptional regulator
VIVTEPTLTDRPAELAVRARRAEVLGALRDADAPLSVQQVMERTGLHVNTARFHLDGLVAAGLAERTAEERAVPGRPRILYLARSQIMGPRSFALLAEMLSGLIVSLDGNGPAAMEAGRSWGRHLVERTAPSESIDQAGAMARLIRLLDAIGFQPEMADSPEGLEVRLRHCPFREVAERHPDIVCAMHLGLMQGALGELRAPVQAESLEPMVTPTYCVARLRSDPPISQPTTVKRKT